MELGRPNLPEELKVALKLAKLTVARCHTLF
jgi:hypothetical protein